MDTLEDWNIATPSVLRRSEMLSGLLRKSVCSLYTLPWYTSWIIPSSVTAKRLCRAFQVSGSVQRKWSGTVHVPCRDVVALRFLLLQCKNCKNSLVLYSNVTCVAWNMVCTCSNLITSVIGGPGAWTWVIIVRTEVVGHIAVPHLLFAFLWQCQAVDKQNDLLSHCIVVWCSQCPQAVISSDIWSSTHAWKVSTPGRLW